MAITTCTEYEEALDALYRAKQAERDAVNQAFEQCTDAAQQRFDAVAANPQASEAQIEAARAQMEQEKEVCSEVARPQHKAIDAKYAPLFADLDRQALEGLVIGRLIISWEDLQPAAVALQNVHWSSNTPAPDSAPILTVQSFDDLRGTLEHDRCLGELLLMVRAEDGALVLGEERKTLSEIVAEWTPTVKTRVSDAVYLFGELTGAPPQDTDGFRAMLGAGQLRTQWTAGPCKLTGISPTTVTLFTGVAQKFTAKGKGLAGVKWIAPGATPASRTGPTFTTMWPNHGKKTLTATCGGTKKKKTTVLVVDVEIQINNTESTEDDIVQGPSDHPGHFFGVPCRIKLIGPAEARAKVKLVNPDDRLVFDLQTSEEMLELSARRWTKFEIAGYTASEKIGDAKIRVQLQYGGGPIVAEKDVTVFSFDQARMRLYKGGRYVLTASGYAPRLDTAADFSAQARLRPAGLDCDAPQIKNLRVGIMQEMSNYLVTTTWDTPKITWKAGVKKGATVTAPKRVRRKSRFDRGPGSDKPLNISIIPEASPLWGTGLWDDAADALKPPKGCADASAATSSHAPTVSLNQKPFRTYQHGRVTWTNHVKTTIKTDFRTFCVIFNTKTKVFYALRQAEWSLDINSSGPPADQRAVVYSDDDVSSNPAEPQGIIPRTETQDAGTAKVKFKKK